MKQFGFNLQTIGFNLSLTTQTKVIFLSLDHPKQLIIYYHFKQKPTVKGS